MATPTTTGTKQVEILVIGGGIGGLAVALGLANHGRSVHVIEKAPQFGELGAGLQVAPNAGWALDRLGVLDAIHGHAVFPKNLVWMDAGSGTQLTTLDVGAPFRERYGYPYVVMHRSDLLDVLLHACEAHTNVTLTASKDVVDVADLETSARVTCADGSVYESPIVIGADGLRSTVRNIILGDGEPECSAYVAYRGTIPIEEMSDDTDFDNVVFWTGPDLHLMQYPVRRGELYNQVAVFKSKRYHAGAHEWGTPDEMDEAFSIGNDFVRKCITKMGRKRRWPMYDRLPVQNWTRNRIILLGDAAHPMLQYLAQGAAQALEDCVVLSDAIAAHPENVPLAFESFQRERAPRTGRVQTMAREWGDYWHLHEGPQKASRDAMLRARSNQDYTPFDWFYGYRGPANAAPVGAGA